MTKPRVDYTEGLEAAVLLLHEEAHGDIPLRMCSADPCREIARYGQVSGAAPHTMPAVAML